MSNYLSRAELDEISNGLIELYIKQHPKKAVQSMDIEHFITGFLDRSKSPFVIWMDGKRFIIREKLVKYLDRQFKI